jgi:hypothetical protein
MNRIQRPESFLIYPLSDISVADTVDLSKGAWDTGWRSAEMAAERLSRDE